MANKYIRQGAAGTGSGDDWTNAYTDIPAALTRGDTYYFADGSYASSGYTFDDNHSGTTRIILKKATAADHGTETGCVTTYGDGQADFDSTLLFTRGYYTFDGVRKNESDWFDGTAYGFKINHNNQDKNIRIVNQSAQTPSVIVQYVFISAIIGNLPAETIARYSIDTYTAGEQSNTGHQFRHLYVEGSNNVWFIGDTDGTIVEYCASDKADGNAENHGEVVNLYWDVNNAIIRYNKFKDEYVPNGSTALIAITNTSGHEIYGNEFSNFRCGDGAIGFVGSTSTNVKVYNNTFSGDNSATSGQSGIQLANNANNIVKNNLWVDCGNISFSAGMTRNYNAYPDANARSEANAQLSVTTSIFEDYAGDDFRLASATDAGETLASPYNTDVLGTTRGADGNWDRGAYEYEVSTPSTVAMFI
jgi:hypothetical protein